MTIELTKENFENTIKSDKPVLVDFWAAWCGPCRMVGPIIDEVSVEYIDKAVVGKVDVDNQHELSLKYGIRSIPTMMIFKDGEPVDRMVGVVPKTTIEDTLNKYLN
jgi:thioredoxin 1